MRRAAALMLGLALLSDPRLGLATVATPADPTTPIPMTLGIPTWEELGPPARAFAASVHDTRRNRLLVIGGYADDQRVGTSSVWALDLSHYPSWSRVRPTGPEPSPRWGACAVYDSLRDRVVMFGGATRASVPNAWPPDSTLDDTWMLSLSGTPAWTRVLHPAGGPQPTDSVGTLWPRVRATFTRDPLRDRAWLFGGQSTDWPETWYDDLWAFDLATLTWARDEQPRTTPWPHARAGHAAVYVPTVDRIVVNGGEYDEQPAGTRQLPRDTWALNPATGAWEDWTGADARLWSPALTDHVLVWWASHRIVVQLPGETIEPAGVGYWSPTIPGWSRDSRFVFDGRPGLAAAWMADRDWIVWTGGGTNGGARADTWGLRDAQPTAPAGVFEVLATPHPVVGTSEFDPRDERLLLLEGGDALWFHDAAAGVWTRVATTGTAPFPVRGSTAVLDTLRRRLLVFGGADVWESPPPLDVHALTIDGVPTWSRVSTSPGPPLAFPPLLWDDDRAGLFVLGHQLNPGTEMRAWHVSVDDSVRWQERPVVGSPSPPPIYGVAVRDTRRGGGWYVGLPALTPWLQDSLYRLELGDTVWVTTIAPAGEPPGGRVFPALLFDPSRDRVLLHAGAGDAWVTPAAKGDLAWEAALGSSPEWRAATPLGDRPPRGAAKFVELPDQSQARLEVVDDRVFRVSWELPPPPPAAAESASVTGGVARLVWTGAATDGWAVRVERRDANGAWQPIGLATSDRDGRWRYVDEEAPAGALAYRLVYDRSAGPIATGEVLLGAAPSVSTLRIASIRPNPARVPERIEFALPRASAVTFELLDVTGRRVWSRETASLDAGLHVVPLGLTADARPGLYWLRVKAGRESASTRVAIVR